MAQSTSSTGNQPLIELRHVDKHYGDLHVLNVIIGLAATLAAAAAAAAALIYRRRHAYPDPVPAGGEDDGYEEDARGREYRDDRYPDGYDRDPYGYDDGYRDSYRDRY